MSSKWTHAICPKCYQEKEPGRVPSVIRPEFAEDENCCFCGVATRDGIYYRADPVDCLFQGLAGTLHDEPA